MSTLQVQRWVTSVLAFTLLEHFAAGLILAAIISPRSDPSARIGLNVIAGVVSVGAVAAVRAIHGRKPLSVWLVFGVLVGVLGYYLTCKF